MQNYQSGGEARDAITAQAALASMPLLEEQENVQEDTMATYHKFIGIASDSTEIFSMDLDIGPGVISVRRVACLGRLKPAIFKKPLIHIQWIKEGGEAWDWESNEVTVQRNDRFGSSPVIKVWEGETSRAAVVTFFEGGSFFSNPSLGNGPVDADDILSNLEKWEAVFVSAKGILKLTSPVEVDEDGEPRCHPNGVKLWQPEFAHELWSFAKEIEEVAPPSPEASPAQVKEDEEV